jgi:hypothetical protein
MLVVPGRPTLASLTFWIMTDDEVAPSISVPGLVASQICLRSLRSGIHPTTQRLFLVALTELAPDREYRCDVRVGVGTSPISARARTLPAALSSAPFSVAFGSCYCLANDPGLSLSYPPKLHAGSEDPIRLRFLTGDQIYMDLTPNNGAPIMNEAPEPFTRYLTQWLKPGFSVFLQAGPNLMIADDHEYWNDYPHGNVWQKWTTQPLGDRMDRAFSLFQGAMNLDGAHIALDSKQDPPASGLDGSRLDRLLDVSSRNFQFRVDPLSFFVLDVRTRRSRYDSAVPQFAPPQWIDAAVKWTRELTGPGVLVLSQPLLEQRNGGLARAYHVMGDINLPDYDANFAALWEALLSAPHDTVVLTGDIHWSRACLATRSGTSSPRVLELCASPWARIPGVAETPGPGRGQVEWRGGRASWNCLYASNLASTYNTVSFARQGAGVQVQARLWNGTPSSGASPALLAEQQLTLS